MRITVKMLLLSLVIALYGQGFSDKPAAVSSSIESATSEILEVTMAVQTLIDDQKLSGAVVAVLYKDKMIHYKARPGAS
jgi:hypothetical protein